MADRLTVISNIAPRYRTEIYRRLEKGFECHWLFGHNETDIAGCDTSMMRDVEFLPVGHGPANSYWLKGAARKALKRDAPDNILMLGEIKFLTSWWILLRNKLSCQRKRKHVVLWTHGWRGNEKGLQKWLTRRYLSLADKVLFYGERARELAVKEGLAPEKALGVHNSLNHALFTEIRKELAESNPDKDSLLAPYFTDPGLPLLVFIGRLTAVKKLHLLLEASHILALRGVPNNVLFIGDGEETQRLKKMADALGMKGQVAFLGSCYDERTSAPFIYLADACVSPGNIGLTVIHSMELGTPAITHNDMTRQVPEAEIIDEGINGRLFEPDSAESLADSIEATIETNKASRQAVRKACHEAVVDWTPDYQFNVITSAFRD